MTTDPKGRELFIVDNSVSGWTGLRYLEEWSSIAKAFDIATGYFEIGALLTLDGKWQELDKIRILMGTETTHRTRKAILEAVRAQALDRLDESIEEDKEPNPFLHGVPAILAALRSGQIECRVYDKDKFHAKAYITHAKLEVVGAQALVGSSNFTRPGLTKNIELNVQIQSAREVAQLQEWFETHWNEARDVTETVVDTISRHTHLYLVAHQLVCAGAPVRAVLFTTPPDRLWRAAGALRKGIGWRRALTRRGVKVMHVSDLAIEGGEQVESVRFTHRGRKWSMQASLVLLHEGVVPNAHLTLAAQLDHVWDDRQHAFRPAADEWGTTSGPGVLVAGDGAHILGAEAAVDSGRIAALEAAHRLGRVDAQRRDALAKRHRASLARHRRFREFLDLEFEPGAAALRPSDPVVTVSRCEEVAVAEIERVIAHGCPGPNQAKAFTRCGMGTWQGRMCATVVSEIFATRRHTGVGATGHYRIRPPVKPLTVGELATLEGTGTALTDRASTPIRPSCART